MRRGMVRSRLKSRIRVRVRVMIPMGKIGIMNLCLGI